MALSYIQYSASGSNDTFAFSFPYITEADIHVYLDGVETFAFTLPSASSVKLNSTPAAGVVVMIKRSTQVSSRLVDFQDGSILNESNLDLDSNQVMYVMQERVDAEANYIALDTDGNLNANNKRIKNVATPVDANDAVNKSFADSVLASAQASATAASGSASAASGSASSASASASAASASAGTASNSSANASASEGNAATSASAANASAVAAAASETNAAASAASIVGSVSAAQTAETNAAASAVTAGTSETNAGTSAIKAGDWAEKTEDVEVELGKYSAKHYANKASASASASAASASGASTSATDAATAQTNAAASEAKAQDWAIELENVEVEPGKYSALHWAAKAEASAQGLDHTHSNIAQLALVTDGDHDVSAHAPSTAQANADITKAEIEAKLTGTISSHNHNGTYEPADATILKDADIGSTVAAQSHSHTGTVTLAALGWTLEQDVSNNLVFKYNGVAKGKLDTSGNFTATADVTAYGTV